LGKEKCGTYELFNICKKHPEFGLEQYFDEGGQEMEYRKKERESDGSRIEYAYIPVKRK